MPPDLNGIAITTVATEHNQDRQHDLGTGNPRTEPNPDAGDASDVTSIKATTHEAETPNEYMPPTEGTDFPVNELPPLLRELCRGLADLHGVPVQFPAALAIATVGGSLGKGLQVDTWRGLKTYPNVYVLAGVLSGIAKSTVGMPIFAPLSECETKHQKEHEAERPKIEAELVMIQKQIAAWIKRSHQDE